jgi:hypothetical protein
LARDLVSDKGNLPTIAYSISGALKPQWNSLVDLCIEQMKVLGESIDGAR